MQIRRERDSEFTEDRECLIPLIVWDGTDNNLLLWLIPSRHPRRYYFDEEFRKETIVLTLRLPTARLAIAGALITIAAVGVRQVYKMLKLRRPPDLPSPGWRKQDPEELDKLLVIGLEDSMAASDPVSVTQPDVHKR